MSFYIGLISGTSMDAVDAVLVSHAEHPPRIVAHHSHPIPEALGALMQSAVADGHAADSVAMWHLDARVGALFADAVEALLTRAGVPSSDVRAIGSHGQTVYHGPDDEPPVSVQIGDPNLIAERTGITTVADFRRRDIAAGGQGAPLAPAFHRAVFQDKNSARVVVNIGGIANLTVLAKDHRKPVTGFDTGPGNTLMDLWCMRHQGSPVDLNGAWAAGGEVRHELLDLFFEDSYFHAAPPKSTGREYFNLHWLDSQIAALDGPAVGRAQRWADQRRGL
jgi:anhydro-N-acetylmuramic acid kinase